MAELMPFLCSRRLILVRIAMSGCLVGYILECSSCGAVVVKDVRTVLPIMGDHASVPPSVLLCKNDW